MRAGGRPAFCWLGLGCVALILTGCRAGVESANDDPLPLEPFSEEAAFEPRTVLEWSLSAEARRDNTSAPSGWNAGGPPGSFGWTDTGLSIAGDKGVVWTQWEVDFSALDVHAVRLLLSDHLRGWARLCWSSELAAQFESQRCMSFQRRPRIRLKEPERLLVARHPLWQGQIRHLRLTIDVGKRPLELEAVRGEVLELDPSTLSGRRSVTLESDAHSVTLPAHLAPLGTRLKRSVPVPRSGTLRLAFGVLPRPVTETTFRVLAPAKEGEPKLLFEQTLRPTRVSSTTGLPQDDRAAWTEVVLGMPGLAGHSAELLFETETPSPPSPAAGLAAWSLEPGAESGPESGRAARPNIVLISIDTLRADHLSLYGHERETTPAIDAWAQRCAAVFDQAVAASPWTLPSHTSIFTGLDALSHQVNYGSMRIPDRLTTLTDHLKAAGYRTRAITGGGFVTPEYGFGRGFDRYEAWARNPASAGDELGAGTERAVKLLRELAGGAPFFLFFHTYEAHWPYYAREPFASRFAGRPIAATRRINGSREDHPEGELVPHYDFRWETYRDPGGLWSPEPTLSVDLADVESLYDSGIAYIDLHVGRILATIDELGLGADTIVVITSDHGENLGEKELKGHQFLFEGNVKIPLIIAAPGCAASRRVASQAQQVDIVPTLLDLAGLPQPSGLDGISLVPAIEGRAPPGSERIAWSYAPSSNVGVSIRVEDRWKYILSDTAWPSMNGTEQLYALRDDPLETQNLSNLSDERESFQAKALERLRADASGALVVLSNRESEALEVRFLGDSGMAWAVKSTAIGPGTATWHGTADGSGTAQADVPSGEEMELLVLDPMHNFPEFLLIEARLGSRPGSSAQWNVPTHDLATWSVAYQDDEWQERSVCNAAQTQICVSYTGQSAGGEAVHLDDGTERRLRALGYLD